MTDEPLDLFSSSFNSGSSSHAQDVPLHAKTSVAREKAPFVEGSRTSKRAAERVEPRRPSQRERVWMYVLSRGPVGCTRPEIACGTGLSENSIRPRVLELMGERDPAYGTPRVVESKKHSRNGCALLYAGVYARDVLHAEDPGAAA